MRLGLRTVLNNEVFQLNFGNGQSALPSSTNIVGSGLTDSSGAASSYSLYEFTYSHTYGALANPEFTAYYTQCCRISSLAYQADTDIRLQTLVRFSDPISPTVNFPAIIQFYQGQSFVCQSTPSASRFGILRMIPSFTTTRWVSRMTRTMEPSLMATFRFAIPRNVSASKEKREDSLFVCYMIHHTRRNLGYFSIKSSNGAYSKRN
jgi:hypothetical protein